MNNIRPNGITDFSGLFESVPSLMNDTNTDDAETFRRLLENMALSIPTPYELAEKEMNKQLKEKRLPDMKKLLEAFEITNPEYFL